MIKNLRFTEQEQEAIRTLGTRMNVKRIKSNREVLTDSKVAHTLLQIAIEQCKVDDNGNLYIEEAD